MFSVVSVYLDHLKFCVLMVEGIPVVMNVIVSVIRVMTPAPALCNLSDMYFWSICFRTEHGVMNCDDICMCLVNKQF